MIVEECLKWAAQRYVFGKPLLAQAVIRQKFAHMIAKVEAIQAWLESVTFQMCNMVCLHSIVLQRHGGRDRPPELTCYCCWACKRPLLDGVADVL
jgi:alkylation response protein AidB-like acyl-CoA dehydrogenase